MMTEERVNQRFAGANVTIEATYDEVIGWQFVMNNNHGQHLDIYPYGFRLKGRMTEEQLKMLQKWMKERLAKDLTTEVTVWVNEHNPSEPLQVLNTLKLAFLAMIIVVHALSLVGQLILPSLLSSPGHWAFALGWQWEIAAWNGLPILFAFLAIKHPERMDRDYVLAAVIALWVIFALNHGIHQDSWWHEKIAIAELTGAIFGFVILMWRYIKGS